MAFEFWHRKHVFTHSAKVCGYYFLQPDSLHTCKWNGLLLLTIIALAFSLQRGSKVSLRVSDFRTKGRLEKRNSKRHVHDPTGLHKWKGRSVSSYNCSLKAEVKPVMVISGIWTFISSEPGCQRWPCVPAGSCQSDALWSLTAGIIFKTTT